MSIVTDLCDKYPHATAAIEKWVSGFPSIRVRTPYGADRLVREYADKHGHFTGDDALAVGPLEDVLAAIEAKVKPVGLTDEQIEAMKWNTSSLPFGVTVEGSSIEGGYFNTTNAGFRSTSINGPNTCVDKLAAEIRRLRAEVEKLKETK